MKSVLVTGATGFIGTHLVDRLTKGGWFVRAATRSRSPIPKLPPGVAPVWADLKDKTGWDKAVKGVNYVIHLAARVHVMSQAAGDEEEKFRKCNVEATQTLAEAAARNGVKRMIFASSVKAMGEFTLPGGAWTENTDCKPRDAYGRSKLAAEECLLKISSESGLEIVILRLPLVYGPGVKANFLNLMRLVHSGVPLPLASVSNCRSLLYVGNLADAIEVCLSHPSAIGETFLVSDNKGVSTPALIRQVACSLKRPARLFSCPEELLRLAAWLTRKQAIITRLVNSSAVDSTRIRKKLGWQPPFTLEQGLEATALWYKELFCKTPKS